MKMDSSTLLTNILLIVALFVPSCTCENPQSLVNTTEAQNQTGYDISYAGDKEFTNDTSIDSESTKEAESSQEPEILPTPQSFFWNFWRPKSQYVTLPQYRKRRPVYMTYDETEERLKSGQHNLHYKDKTNKEWVYVIPDPDEISNYRQDLKSELDSTGYKDYEYYDGTQDTYRPYPKHYQRVRNYPPPRFAKAVSDEHSRQKSVPFFKRLINTGTGFLRLLNPLTYFTNSAAQPLPVTAEGNKYRERPYNNPYYKPLRYKEESEEEEEVRNRPYVPEFDDEYKAYKEKQKLLGNSKYMQHYNEFYNDEYTLVDDDYEYDDEMVTISSDFLNDFKYGNYFDDPVKESLENNKKKSFPQPPPNYDPRSKPHTVKKSGKDPTENHNYHSQYDNIYKFQNLEMLYDPNTLEHIKNVQDEQTLEYLNHGNLRDDLYIGKDGNIYIRDTPKEHTKYYEQETRRMDTFRPSDRDEIRDKMTRKRRYPLYTALNRARNPQRMNKYQFWRGQPSSSYAKERSSSTYINRPKQESSYGSQNRNSKQESSYGSQNRNSKQESSYGSQNRNSKQESSYGSQNRNSKQESSYGSQNRNSKQEPSYDSQNRNSKQEPSYGSQNRNSKQESSYGSQNRNSKQEPSYGSQNRNYY